MYLSPSNLFVSSTDRRLGKTTTILPNVPLQGRKSIKIPKGLKFTLQREGRRERGKEGNYSDGYLWTGDGSPSNEGVRVYTVSRPGSSEVSNSSDMTSLVVHSVFVAPVGRVGPVPPQSPQSPRPITSDEPRVSTILTRNFVTMFGTMISTLSFNVKPVPLVDLHLFQ